MKKVYTETGKYLYDISKITLGLAVITPLIKGGSVNTYAVLVSALLFLGGAILIHKGDTDDT
jgi:hypothetical protein